MIKTILLPLSLLLLGCNPATEQHEVIWNPDLTLPHNQLKPTSIEALNLMLDERFDQDEHSVFSIETEQAGTKRWLKPKSCRDYVEYKVLNTRNIRFTLAAVWQDYCRAMQVAVNMQPYTDSFITFNPKDYYTLLAPIVLSDCCDAWRNALTGLAEVGEIKCKDKYSCNAENNYSSYEININSIGDYNSDGKADVSLLISENYTQGTGMSMIHLIASRDNKAGKLIILDYFPKPSL
ncbi:MAG: hypothetical protein OEX12_11700 [Gammaproteobacteria bacterium]|nr:hypothetical protein [Gammaproteobacteria bacterium]